MRKRVILIAIGTVLMTVSLVTSVFFYGKYQEAKKMVQSVTGESPSEAKKIIESLAKHTVLPTGEEPRIATVTELQKVENQPFFRNAKNGDKVVIYTQAKKAILYRQSIDRIIEMGPVLDDGVAETATATASASASRNMRSEASGSAVLSVTPTEAEEVTVAIYNATNAPGLAAQAQSTLEASSVGEVIRVVTKANSVKDYTANTVVNLNGGNTQVVDTIAKLMKAEATLELLEGEKRPDADILVIIAQ